MPDFRSDRLFRLYTFNPTHRQLILRSEPVRGRETRVEIHFGNVSFLALQPILRGVDLRAASPQEARSAAERYGLAADDHESIFLVDRAEPMSFVVSGNPSWREADRAVQDPSLFDFSQPWPPGPDMAYGQVS